VSYNLRCIRQPGIFALHHLDASPQNTNRMPPKILLRPGSFYHVFNRGNNRDNIFLEADNYRYFLALYTKYIRPIARTYAYSLLPNHFHLLLSIRQEHELDLKFVENCRKLSQPFSNLFNAYAKAINNRYNRVSSLFEDRFERTEITTDEYFTKLIYYIHANPQKHGYIGDFRQYPYSSYRAFLTDAPTYLERAAVWNWFGGREQFKMHHDALYDDCSELVSQLNISEV
jgi:REP element-mobilizing transposase RayT